MTLEKMIVFSDGNMHNIDHFVRFWNYAKSIAELDEIDSETQFILEVAAIIHEITCLLFREKYGNTTGKQYLIGSCCLLPVTRQIKVRSNNRIICKQGQ